MTQRNASSPKRNRAIQHGRVAMLALVALGSLYLWAIADSVHHLMPHMLMFIAGPLLMFLDRLGPGAPTRGWHQIEAGARVATLASLCALTGSSLDVAFYLINFLLMCVVFSWGLRRFIVPPWHWLRYDHWFNTGFLVAMVSAIVVEIGLSSYQKGLGGWLLGSLMLVVLVAWRHALWFNPSQQLVPAQHQDVWPQLFQMAPSREEFWVGVLKYKPVYGETLLILRSLPLAVLLDFFQMDGSAAKNVMGSHFVDDVKTVINEKDPRASLVWEMYSDPQQAAEYIARIDEHVSREPTESLELPAL